MRRNALAILTALCVVGGMMGCSKADKKSAPQPTAPIAETVRDTGWELALESKCTDEASADDCVGAYGFRIKKDGSYELGPAPGGKTRKGILTDAEKARVEAAILAALDQGSEHAESQAGLDYYYSGSDQISLKKGNGQGGMLIQTNDADLFYQFGSEEEAKGLYDLVKELSFKYYLTPFPNDCYDTANEVQQLFDGMRSCTNDSECAFMDSSFDALPVEFNGYLVTDACSLIHPLAIGNAKKVQAEKDNLIEAYNRAHNACGGNLARPNCGGYEGVTLPGASPKCDAGVCKIRLQGGQLL